MDDEASPTDKERSLTATVICLSALLLVMLVALMRVRYHTGMPWRALLLEPARTTATILPRVETTTISAPMIDSRLRGDDLKASVPIVSGVRVSSRAVKSPKRNTDAPVVNTALPPVGRLRSSPSPSPSASSARRRSSVTSSREWEVDWSKLRLQRVIGHGSFGEVWYGTWLGAPAAIKVLLPALQTNREVVDRFLAEIMLMVSLHHPNIVMFLGACLRVPHMCLVLEHCEHGSLHDFLAPTARHGIPITMSLLYRFALDIARGVFYLHKKQHIVQRDLKARNVLIDASLNAKITDFGLSRVLGDDPENLTACGTPAWTAPEIIRMETYSEKVDVYSFGIILWELLMREEPFRGQKGMQVAYAAAEQGLRPAIPAFCPIEYADLMRRCWAGRPEDRPSFAEILEILFALKKEHDGVGSTEDEHGVMSRIAATSTGDGAAHGTPADAASSLMVIGKGGLKHPPTTAVGPDHEVSLRWPGRGATDIMDVLRSTSVAGAMDAKSAPV